MSILELAISAPGNNAVFESPSSTITFTGSVTTSAGAPTTSGVYFKWFSTVAPWASADTDAHMNVSLQGSGALNFSTNKGGWGMGTRWIQFTCMDTNGMTSGDIGSVSTNGFDGGKNTITLGEWTVNPRAVHVLNAGIIHPSKNDRFDYGTGGDTYWQCRTSGAASNTYAPFYLEMREIMAWTIVDARTETAVTDWNDDTDDELVAELHQGSVGTAGDAVFKSDVNSSTFVSDLTNNTWLEYQKSCLWFNWGTTSVGVYTFNLIVYHKDNRITTVNASTTIEVVA